MVVKIVVADASWGNEARSINNRHMLFLTMHINNHILLQLLTLFFQLLSLDVIEFSQEALDGNRTGIMHTHSDTYLITIRVTITEYVLVILRR